MISGFLLDLRKIAPYQGSPTGNPEDTLSGGDEPAGSSTRVQGLMDAGGESGMVGVLRKLSLCFFVLVFFTECFVMMLIDEYGFLGFILVENARFIKVEVPYSCRAQCKCSGDNCGQYVLKQLRNTYGKAKIEYHE